MNLSWQRDLAVPTVPALSDVEIFYSVSCFFRNLDQHKVIPVTPVAESAGYPSTLRWSAFLLKGPMLTGSCLPGGLAAVSGPVSGLRW